MKGRVSYVGRALLHLDEEAEPEVAVLQEYPVTRGHSLVEQLARRRLLPLPHRYHEHLLLALLGKVDDGSRGVGPHGEQSDGGHARRRLLAHRLQVERARVHVPLAQRADDVRLHGEERAVLTHRTHHKHTLEVVEPLVKLWDGNGLGRVVIVPG